MGKYCSHCGGFFEAPFANAKLCLPCWKKRERAFSEYDELKALLRYYEENQRRLLADLRLARSRHMESPRIPSDILRKLILLAHPDKHGGSETANEITTWLLARRQETRDRP